VLARKIAEGRARRDILLMTHIVVGYPNLQASLDLVDAMVEAGVDLIELQIPFSEPMADGPVILQANQGALAEKVGVEDCLAFAQNVTRRHPIPFLFMTYYNILYCHGVERFAERMQKAGICGSIVADLPFEEGTAYLSAMENNGLCPIFIVSPSTPLERMQAIAKHAKGFVYCVARTGVTGQATRFGEDLTKYLERYRKATSLPLAVGFGVKDAGDISFSRGKADIAVVASETLRVFERSGIAGVKGFLSTLRPES
jgi:tryptophan synthase alpha chain